MFEYDVWCTMFDRHGEELQTVYATCFKRKEALKLCRQLNGKGKATEMITVHIGSKRPWDEDDNIPF